MIDITPAAPTQPCEQVTHSLEESLEEAERQREVAVRKAAASAMEYAEMHDRMGTMEAATAKADAVKGVLLKQIRQMLSGMSQGQVLLRLMIWRMAVEDGTAASVQYVMRMAPENPKQGTNGAATEGGSHMVRPMWQRAGVRQARLALARLMRGEVAMRLVVWRIAAKDAWAAVQDVLRRVQGDLDEERRHRQTVEAALESEREQSLKEASDAQEEARRVSDELEYVRVRADASEERLADELSRSQSSRNEFVEVQDEARRARRELTEEQHNTSVLERRLAEERQSLEARTAAMQEDVAQARVQLIEERRRIELLQAQVIEERCTISRVVSLRQLRQTMVRVMRGDVGLRVDIWRTSVWLHVHHTSQVRRDSRVAVLTDANGAMMQRAGVRQARLALARLMRGEVAMRLVVWRASLQEAYRCHAMQHHARHGEEAIKAEVEKKIRKAEERVRQAMEQELEDRMRQEVDEKMKQEEEQAQLELQLKSSREETARLADRLAQIELRKQSQEEELHMALQCQVQKIEVRSSDAHLQC